MSDLHFDPHQFAGRGMYPASAKSSLAFTDYQRMHTEEHHARPAAWCPPFAMDDKKLQKVLLLRGWRYMHGRGIPALDRNEINRRATKKAVRGSSLGADAPAIQHEMVAKHRAAVLKAGGFLQLHASIAFRSWRLGMNSCEVAGTLNMTPQAVRQALWRLRDAAKSLGFDVGRAGHSAGTKRPRKRRPGQRSQIFLDPVRAVALYRRGVKIADIAVRLGYKRGQGNNRIRRALLVAGVYEQKSRA